MKQIRETFTDEEHKKLIKSKGEQSWHDFIMSLASQSPNLHRRSLGAKVTRDVTKSGRVNEPFHHVAPKEKEK